MKYYITKHNIALCKKPFDNLESAIAFGKNWLKENNDLNQAYGTLQKTKWGFRKGRYNNTYNVSLKGTYIGTYGTILHHENTVLITQKQD